MALTSEKRTLDGEMSLWCDYWPIKCLAWIRACTYHVSLHIDIPTADALPLKQVKWCLREGGLNHINDMSLEMY